MVIMHQLTTLDTMQGSSFSCIRSAVTIFQCHDLDIADFEVMVVREKTSPVVVFISREKNTDTRKLGQTHLNLIVPGKHFHNEIGNWHDAFALPRKSIGVRVGAGVEMNSRDLNALITNRDHLKVIDTLQGASFQPIQVAVTVFQQRNLDLQHYNITLLRDGNSLVVIFTDKDGKPDVLGNPGPRLGFEVKLDGHDMRVLRSNFIR